MRIYGSVFYLFGGRNSEQYFNDLYIFNMISSKWTFLNHSSTISPRSGACMDIGHPYIFIHGGKNQENILSDFWIYFMPENYFFELVVKGTRPALFNHICHIFKSDFVVFAGVDQTGKANPYKYIFKQDKLEWHIESKDYLFAISNPAKVYSEPILFLIGGSKYNEARNTILLYNYANASILYTLPFFLSGHKASILGKSIVIYGGHETNGKNIIEDKGSPLMINITFKELGCSLGFYGENCTICPPGTYSENFNSESCSVCSPGTFAQEEGNWFDLNCLPCPYGTFTDKNKSSRCYDCTLQDECKFKTIERKYRSLSKETFSIQPEPYDESKDDVEHYNYLIGISVASIIGFMCLFYLKNKGSKIFVLIDFYQDQHNRSINEEPYPTSIGGLFTYIFLLLLVIFVSSPLISYFFANISEVKTLVPVFTLLNKRFTAQYFKLEIIFYDYGGTCISDKKCASRIQGSIKGLFTSSPTQESECEEIEVGVCSIRYFLKDIEFEENGSLDLSVNDKAAFASGIQITMSISSSLPGRYNQSFIQKSVEAPKNKVFNGLDPTIFYINAIPSVLHN